MRARAPRTITLKIVMPMVWKSGFWSLYGFGAAIKSETTMMYDPESAYRHAVPFQTSSALFFLLSFDGWVAGECVMCSCDVRERGALHVHPKSRPESRSL